MITTEKKFYRSSSDRIIFGVCGGLGEYFHIDAILVRALFLVLTLAGGGGVILYLLLALITPLKTKAGEKLSVDLQTESLKEELGESAKKIAANFHNHRDTARQTLGLLIIAGGLLLLLFRYFSFHFNWYLFYPIVIVLFGVLLLTKNNKHN